MKLLVTGGAGFIGSNLSKLLVDEGHEVIVLDDLSTGYEDNLKKTNVKFIKRSIIDKEALDTATSNVDAVFHLAGSVGRQKSIDFPINDSHLNLIGTIELLESMVKNNVKKIIFSSSAAIFGELLETTIVENHPLNANSPYGVSKLAAEKMILAYSDLYKIDAVCLRYFNIYGENQRFDAYGNVIPIFANNIFKKKPIIIYGNGRQTRDFLHVSDVAKANLMALNSNIKKDVFNLGSGTTLEIKELAQKMMAIADIEVPIIYKPFRLGDVMHAKASTTKSKDLLSFTSSINLDIGLENYMKWFQKNSQ